MNVSNPAVVVDGLVKSYGGRNAVAGLSFSVAQGEVFALLGPNGAGKTTTVEILEGYRQGESGRVTVLGHDPARGASEWKARVGIMPQDGGLPPAITAPEALRLFSTFYPHPRDPEELLRLVGLEESGRTRYRRLSGGQKQRLSLALALLPRPELVFLDEPTAGLDPQARRATWQIVQGLRAEGVTVLLTTHYLEEAEALADRVAIIDHGRLLAIGTPAALMGDDRSMVRLDTAVDVPLEALNSLPSARSVQRTGPGHYVFAARDTPSLLAEVTAAMRDRKIDITQIRAGQTSLEEVFLRLTEAQV